ncbi:hypothetical protein ACRYCC_35030 [Actinomadura scrupuli]|uniref:hypothetical protein n=1 Tax=Actinomadura scrupuli TaxID=559629 RepID=UPI003D967240
MTGTDDDHLAALFLSQAEEGSRGVYVPGGFDLHLRGADALADRLVHHHEAQHFLLTATTAWGAALLVASKVPAWRPLFESLLDRCRATQESFATFMGCSVVAVGFGPSAAIALMSYPEYLPLMKRLERYLAAVPGEHRRALATSALARACMQTPILRQMIASWPEAVTTGALRGIDVPDERFTVLLRDPQGLPRSVVAAADEAVATEFGPEPLAADAVDASPGLALDDRFDDAWARWEDTVYAGLAARLTDAGAIVLGGHDHLSESAELVALASSHGPGLGVTVDPSPDLPDDRVLARVLVQSRLWLSALPRPARMITMGDEVDAAEVIRVMEATTRMGGRPNVVINARLPDRLLAGYELPADERAVLAGCEGPVTVTRTIADDGTDTETDAVWLLRLDKPDDVGRLATGWAGRGDLTCCVAASCLADSRWSAEWLPLLGEAAPIVWLIDVAIRSLAGEFGSGTVHGLHVDLGPNPTGVRNAVAFHISGKAGVWLAVADEVGVQMITRQMAELPGIDLQMTGADWTKAIPTLRLALHDLLRTESYVDLRALSEHGG